jgi:hypothetical protein
MSYANIRLAVCILCTLPLRLLFKLSRKLALFDKLSAEFPKAFTLKKLARVIDSLVPPRDVTVPLRGVTAPPRGVTVSPRGVTVPPRYVPVPPRGVTMPPRGETVPPRGVTGPPIGVTARCVTGVTGCFNGDGNSVQAFFMSKQYRRVLLILRNERLLNANIYFRYLAAKVTSGNIQGTLMEHSGNIQCTSSEQSMNIQ